MIVNQLIVILSTIVYVSLRVNAGSVEDSLMEKIKHEGKADAVLQLPSIIDSVLSNPALALLNGDAKTDMMISLMEQLTTVSQAPFISLLEKMGVGVQSVQSFWVNNKIFIKGVNLPLITALQTLTGGFSLRLPIQVKLSEHNPSISARAAGSVEWGVVKIGAPSVWTKTDGKGVIVAIIDTGVFMEHEALKGNFGGQWHDAVDGKPAPHDDVGHGTHVTGIVCGSKGIGVAPGAKWVACRGLGKDGGTETTLSDCAQWLLKLKEKPVVVANSWGDVGNNKFYDDEILAWQNAGNVHVFAIGNEGPGCSTSGSPGDRTNVISVGAVTNTSAMTTFSSRGPAKGSNILKPEVSAPGQNIRSAWFTGPSNYEILQGTSMACPHVAGAVALMRAANHSLGVKDILAKLQNTAEHPSPLDSNDLKCGDVGTKNWPNNAYGSGVINVAKAIN